jgi:hypothetical protein
VDLARLTVARRLAEAARAIVQLPTPVAGPLLICEARPITFGTAVAQARILVRNVGEADFTLIRVECGAPEVATRTSTPIPLPRRTARRDAVPIEIAVDPFHAPRQTRPIDLRLTMTDAEGVLVTSTFSVACERKAIAGPVPILEQSRFTCGPRHVRGLHLFELEAPTGREAVLHLEAGGENPHQYSMVRGGRHFRVAVPLRDSVLYRYRFSVDGVLFHRPGIPPDPGPGAEPGWSDLEAPPPPGATLRVRNAGDVDLIVTAGSNGDRVTVQPSKVRVRPWTHAVFQAVLDLSGQDPGTVTAAVRFTTNALDPNLKQLSASIDVPLTAPSSIPDVDQRRFNVGVVYAGAPRTAMIPLRNRGMGELAVTLTSSDPVIQALAATVKPGPDSHELQVRLIPPDAPTNGGLVTSRVALATNSLVAGQRELALTISYRLAVMRIEPASIDFGEVTPGDSLQYTVQVRHESSLVIDPVVASPPPWMTVTVKSGELIVGVRPPEKQSPADQRVDATLEIRDKGTGLVGKLVVRGEIVVPRIAVLPESLMFGGVSRLTEPRRQRLRILNQGRGELRLEKIVLDHEWLAVEVPSTASTADPEIDVRILSNKMSTGSHRGVIEITSNDVLRETVSIPVKVTVTA